MARSIITVDKVNNNVHRLSELTVEELRNLSAVKVDYALSDADINSRPPRLVPIDSVSHRLFCSVGKYACGFLSSNNRVLILVDIDTKAVNQVYTFPTGWTISDVYAGRGCFLVMAVETATNTYSLWRTIDGSSVDRVHDIGRDPNGDLTHRPHVRLLQRGIAQGFISSKPALVMATYNVATDNAVANPGEIGDAIYIAKSMDDGATWERVNTWNWDFDAGSGSRTIKHFHAVIWDKFRSIWWIASGDSADESAMIRWDGSGAGPGNVLPADLRKYPGWDARTGSQRWRTVDMLVTEDWIESFTDTVNDVVGGIWRVRPDFTGSHRVDHSNRNKKHDGWSALLHSSGVHLWCDNARADTDNNNQRYIGIYASTDGNKYYDIGHIHLTGTGVKIPRGFFECANGYVWFSCDSESGKGAYSTNIYKLDGLYRDDMPENLGPCYFVDFENGIDSNDGYTMSTAWKTARNAFGSNKMTHGARLILPFGSSVEDGVSVINYAANASPSTDTTRNIQVSGKGRDYTSVILSGATEGWKDATASKTWDILLDNFTIKQADALKAIIWDNSTATGGTPKWTLIDMTVGDSITGSSRALYLRTAICDAYRSSIKNIKNSTKYVVYSDVSAVINMYSCILSGGRSIQRTGAKVTLTHSEVRSYASTGFTIDSTATVAPKIAWCVFGDDSDQLPIINSSGTVTLTDSDVYGCYYMKPASAGVPGPIVTVSAELLRDGDTLIPFSFSNLVGISTESLVTWDYNGELYRKIPTIGAFEVEQ